MTASRLMSAEPGVELEAPDGVVFPVQEVRGCAVVVASGEIDLCTSPALVEALEIAAGSSNRVILDLSDVRFLDSSGLAAMVGALDGDERRQGVALVLVGVSTMVRKLLHITCLSNRFPVYASVDAAVAHAG
jgi:anti-sigma B factor antagonist